MVWLKKILLGVSEKVDVHYRVIELKKVAFHIF